MWKSLLYKESFALPKDLPRVCVCVCVCVRACTRVCACLPACVCLCAQAPVDLPLFYSVILMNYFGAAPKCAPCTNTIGIELEFLRDASQWLLAS